MIDCVTKSLRVGYETVQLQTTLLSSLPPQIATLNETLASLQNTLQQNTSSAPGSSSLSLPLDATQELLSAREMELADLNQQLKSLQQALGSWKKWRMS